ncbi:MAG TPA: type II toxin-antitoxin system VapC family toxin [Candidatus Limnocylindria bacterium]
MDASAALDLVLQARASKGIEAALQDEDIRAPVHLDAEVFKALRRLVRTERLPLADAMVALDDLRRLLVTRHAIGGMVFEAMALRDRFGGHDVFFAILARQLGATLVTSDARLARAAEGYVRVRAFL